MAATVTLSLPTAGKDPTGTDEEVEREEIEGTTAAAAAALAAI